MPTYLLHGFRWPRQLIRVHIILQNLEDSAAEWLMAPKTTLELLKNFNSIYPDCMENLNGLRFIEQYDPNDLSAAAASQPYAYVADTVEEIKLGVEVEDIRGRGVNNEQWTAMMELRDKLAPDEKVGWFIVVCGDVERLPPPSSSGPANGNGVSMGAAQNTTSVSPRDSESVRGAAAPEIPRGRSTGRAADEDKELKGLRKLFSSTRLGKSKSKK
jgi:hypothetical protein